jgi:hypothetical protein
MPYFVQKAEQVQERHSGWTKKVFPDGGSPTSVFKQHVLCCFIDDPLGVDLLDHFNGENVMWEGDFPHADTSWPNGPETAMKDLAHCGETVINAITHENAMRHFQFDPFKVRPRERCTVSALRAEASDVDVETHVGRLVGDDEDQVYRRTASAVFAAAGEGVDR